MIQRSKQLLWRLLAVVGLILAIVGAVLPVMPTVPFLLLSAWAAGRGWPALETYMLNHAKWGPPIRQWREHGAVSRKAKWLACSMMLGSGIMIWFMPVPVWVRLSVDATLLGVGVWLSTRPEPVPQP